MSPLWKAASKKAGPLNIVKPYILPVYIVLSALFILYAAYGYLRVSVYQAWAQDGYNTAYGEIINAALDPQSCQGISIPGANSQVVTLINVECLQQPAVDPQQETAE